MRNVHGYTIRRCEICDGHTVADYIAENNYNVYCAYVYDFEQFLRRFAEDGVVLVAQNLDTLEIAGLIMSGDDGSTTLSNVETLLVKDVPYEQEIIDALVQELAEPASLHGALNILVSMPAGMEPHKFSNMEKIGFTHVDEVDTDYPERLLIKNIA